MSCPTTANATAEDRIWFEQFQIKSLRERVPISGMLELTSRCNLKCVHCYLGDQAEQHAKRDQELDTERFKSVIDELADAGCLYLVITGGDPMMRKDFVELYLHAIRRGLLVTVFCDGVLVSERIIEVFREYPPRRVEVSLYGATAETYEAVTQVRGSFSKCIRGIERLLDAGLNVGLKTVLMTLNQHELETMREIARGYGCSFRFDSAIFPCLPDANKDPLDLRVEPRIAVEKELADPETRESWQRYHESRQGTPNAETLYKCGAGLTGFYVGPLGDLSPCLMTTQHRFSLSDASFEQRWRHDMLSLRKRKPKRQNYGCNTCEKQTLCTGCPAFNWLETGEEDRKSDYVCETTHERWRALFGDSPPKPAPAYRASTIHPERQVRSGHPALPIIKEKKQ
ncbi:MAG: radical SAM protein [Myxococcota bacterium]